MNPKGNRQRKLWALVLLCALCLLFFCNTAFAAEDHGIFDIVNGTGRHTSGAGGITDDDGSQSIELVITKYKTIATAIMGILTITMLIFMLIQFTRLGAAGDNETGRKRAIMGILTTGIATALLGGATIVVGFFWNLVV